MDRSLAALLEDFKAMSSLVSACKRLALVAVMGATPFLALGQARFDSLGSEYGIIGALTGDQVFSQVALNASGGYLVWQDNATDGDGSGISARRINRSLSGALGSFRVNEAGAGDQTQPQLALLSNGGVAFVWQSAVANRVKVYARFLNPDGTFATGDVAVSNYTGGDQTSPVIASLPGGNVVIAWSSVGQERNASGAPISNGMQGVFAQIFSPTGQKVGDELQANSTATLNQRNPAVTAFPNGGFVIAWVTEAFRGVTFSVDSTGRVESGAGVENYDISVAGQIFSGDGKPVGGELALSSAALICANPTLVTTETGFTAAWSGKVSHPLTTAERDDGWDVYARQFGFAGVASKSEFRVNSFSYGDQYRPRVAFQDGINLMLWTSLGQDGSFEGVVARLFTANGDMMSKEFRANTTTVGQQIYPTVAATGDHTFLTVWSGFVAGGTGFDLFAQRYSSTAEPALAAPAAPYVSALSQTRLAVTWPELSGYQGVKYEVYVDESTSPVIAENNSALIVSLQPDSTHLFRLAYVLADGRRSPVSDSASGKTWGEDANFDGLPDDWQVKFWGADSTKWPGGAVDSDGDGATNVQELLAGTNPIDADSVLRARMLSTSQGPRLEWNTEAGCIYQVQAQNADRTWGSIGTPRFAAGTTDSIPVDGDKTVALYRVIRVR